MRTISKTVTRREHWRWQRCGPGRSELRHVQVRQSAVTLAPTDTRQIDMLDAGSGRTSGRISRCRRGKRDVTPDAPRQVLRSYWRNQPYGPRNALRKIILVDVTR